MTTIISIYVSQIIDEKWEWANVPPILLPQVEELYTQLTGKRPEYRK